MQKQDFKWVGKSESRPVFNYISQQITGSCVIIAIMSYGLFFWAPIKTDLVWISYLFVGIGVCMLIGSFWRSAKYLGAVYVIDCFGPRAYNHFLGISWQLSPERSQFAEVKIINNLGHLTWTAPVHSSKSGRIVFPGDGFWFVKDHHGMIEALENWTLLVAATMPGTETGSRDVKLGKSGVPVASLGEK